MRLLIVLCCLMTVSACSTRTIAPDAVNEKSLHKAQQTAENFESEKMQRYFDEAVAYAVYPSVLRAGTGFGGAYGNGWVFEKTEAGEYQLSGKTYTGQFNAGAQLGVQVYSLIIFFKTDRVYRRFRKGTFEFAGQAYGTVLLWGAGVTPAYSPDVASFAKVKGGLILEASVGAHRYDFVALDKDAEE